jgi:hypothetical protein
MPPGRLAAGEHRPSSTLLRSSPHRTGQVRRRRVPTLGLACPQIAITLTDAPVRVRTDQAEDRGRGIRETFADRVFRYRRGDPTG